MNAVSPPVESTASSPATETSPPTRHLFWLLIWTLASRELVRFFRQRTRLVGALGQPILFWILFGAGLGGSFQPPKWAPETMSYQEYFFPGVAVLIVMFTAIFSTISIIEDRREGFLQAVLVAPISRLSLVLGKLFGGTALAVLQAMLFLLVGPALSVVGLAPEFDVSLSITGTLVVIGYLTLLAFGLTALGYVIAWPLDSTQGFHAIMSVFLMPMWLLSGSFFPAAESGWLSWVMKVNPLTYGVAGLRRLMSPGLDDALAGGLPSMTMCVILMSLFALVTVWLAVFLTNRRLVKDAR